MPLPAGILKPCKLCQALRQPDDIGAAVPIQIGNHDGVTRRQVRFDRMFPETYGSLTPDKGYEQKKKTSKSYKKTS
jgi:hypothetical protein